MFVMRFIKSSFVDIVTESNTLHSPDPVSSGHVDELQQVWFSLEDSRRNAYELSAFILNIKK